MQDTKEFKDSADDLNPDLKKIDTDTLYAETIDTTAVNTSESESDGPHGNTAVNTSESESDEPHNQKVLDPNADRQARESEKMQERMRKETTTRVPKILETLRNDLSTLQELAESMSCQAAAAEDLAIANEMARIEEQEELERRFPQPELPVSSHEDLHDLGLDGLTDLIRTSFLGPDSHEESPAPVTTRPAGFSEQTTLPPPAAPSSPSIDYDPAFTTSMESIHAFSRRVEEICAEFRHQIADDANLRQLPPELAREILLLDHAESSARLNTTVTQALALVQGTPSQIIACNEDVFDIIVQATALLRKVYDETYGAREQESSSAQETDQETAGAGSSSKEQKPMSRAERRQRERQIAKGKK
ncbi:hypothetical protein M426DRAFT_27526 [Hypoxylon sp. CI-4A]|nr:hypothetical protein M426DRAFT_27526 [Hypoxylon sp. CI-4A]